MYAMVSTLAAGRKMSRSMVAAQLIDKALMLPEIQEELMETVETIGVAEELPDTRTKPRQRHHYREWADYELTYRDRKI